MLGTRELERLRVWGKVRQVRSLIFAKLKRVAWLSVKCQIHNLEPQAELSAAVSAQPDAQ